MESFGDGKTPTGDEIAPLDAVFSALADPTRRKILKRLQHGEASVAELCKPFAMSQPAISKHLKVLERAGLVERGIDAQRRPARLRAEPLRAAVSWLEEFQQFWMGSFAQLDEVLEEMKQADGDRPVASKQEGEA